VAAEGGGEVGFRAREPVKGIEVGVLFVARDVEAVATGDLPHLPRCGPQVTQLPEAAINELRATARVERPPRPTSGRSAGGTTS